MLNKLSQHLFRIFGKVTLSYGNGPRSAPMDLLLYDSHCWDCADSGECAAKTKRPECIFAAGSQHIQIFRIGRTISPTQNINKNPGKQDKHHYCSFNS